VGRDLKDGSNNRRSSRFHTTYGRPGIPWPKGNRRQDATAEALTPPAWSLAVRRCATADIATLTATDRLGLAESIALVFTLYRDQPGVDVEWRVTNKTADPRPEGGWLCFPFEIAQPKFLLGRLGGPIDPAKDIVAGANRHYFCLSSGLTITGPDGGGVGVCPLDSSCVSLGAPGVGAVLPERHAAPVERLRQFI